MIPKTLKIMYVGELPSRVRPQNSGEKIDVFYGDVIEIDKKYAEDLLRYKRSGFVMEGVLDKELIEKNRKSVFKKLGLKDSKEKTKKEDSETGNTGEGDTKTEDQKIQKEKTKMILKRAPKNNKN